MSWTNLQSPHVWNYQNIYNVNKKCNTGYHPFPVKSEIRLGRVWTKLMWVIAYKVVKQYLLVPLILVCI